MALFACNPKGTRQNRASRRFASRSGGQPGLHRAPRLARFCLVRTGKNESQQALVSRLRNSFHKDAENRRHAALQILAIATAIAAVCVLPDDDFDIFTSSMNF